MKGTSGKNVRKLDTLIRDHFDHMRHAASTMTDEEIIEWNARLTNLLSQRSGSSPFTLTATATPPPITEKTEEKLVYRVKFYVKRENKRIAKEYIKACFSLNFFPNGMSTEDPNIIFFPVYSCTQTQAVHAKNNSNGLITLLEINE